MSNWIKKYWLLVVSIAALVSGVFDLFFACRNAANMKLLSKNVATGANTGFIFAPSKSKPKPPSCHFYDNRSQLPDISIEPDDKGDWAFQSAGLALYYALYDMWLDDPEFVEKAFKKHGFEFTVTLPYTETHRKPA